MSGDDRLVRSEHVEDPVHDDRAGAQRLRIAVHPIEAESYRRLSERLDLGKWSPGPRAVVSRVVHATADPTLAEQLVVPDHAVTAGVAALAAGQPVLCDVHMVQAGISAATTVCMIPPASDPHSLGAPEADPFGDPSVPDHIDRPSGPAPGGPTATPTRSAAGLIRAAAVHRDGAVVAVGCAPTALFAVAALIAEGRLHPALVIGVPVGFVGAAESKEELLAVCSRHRVPVITLPGERGGAAVAVAIVNALVRLAKAAHPPTAAPGPDRAGEAPSDGTAATTTTTVAPRAAGEGNPETTDRRGDGPPATDTGTGDRGSVAPEASIEPSPSPTRRLYRDHRPAMLLIGHGTRSEIGVFELRRFAELTARARPEVALATGYIEFVDPSIDEAVDELVDAGATEVIAVPLVLLAAGHLKDDGPAALARARRRHPGVTFSYARDLGVHPLVLDAVTDRIHSTTPVPAGGGPTRDPCANPSGPHWDPNTGARPRRPDAVVVVGRGSTDPDANADLMKAARLLADGRQLTNDAGTAHARKHPAPDAPPLGMVEGAFVSLARPDVVTTLDRCYRLGARRIVVAPYFLFHGLLVERIVHQAREWAARHPDTTVACARQIGVDQRIVDLVWSRYDQLLGGTVVMNCDGCLYRTPLPGYSHRVGAPLPIDP